MSGSRAKAKRKAEGVDLAKRGQKQPTPLLERSYVQMPVGVSPEGNVLYRSGAQIKKFLARKGVAVEDLGNELREWMKAYGKEVSQG